MSATLQSGSSKEVGQVTFGHTVISYRVRRSARRKKTVSIRVSAEGVVVSAPQTMRSDRLEQFVRARGSWIMKKQAYYSALIEEGGFRKRFVNGETLSYLGRQYRLKRSRDATTVKLAGRYFIVPEGDPEDVRKLLMNWYYQQAYKRLPERVDYYSRKLGLASPPILVRDQQKRWGSCNAKGVLRFNWRVMMAPLKLVDYVVAHELVHLEHMNHSKAYWQRLEQILPDYRLRRQQLDQRGNQFTL